MALPDSRDCVPRLLGDCLPQVTCLLSDFCSFADRRDVGGLCGLFTPDGRLEVSGSVHVGRAAIAASLASRFQNKRQTRHLWTNLRLETSGAGELRCTTTQVTFERQVDAGTTEVRVSDVSDVLRRQAAHGWLIHERVVTRAMT